MYFFSQDAHGDRDRRFARDKSQDYQLVVGYQYQGGTVLRFRRKLNTCDGDDLVITVRNTYQSCNATVIYFNFYNFPE